MKKQLLVGLFAVFSLTAGYSQSKNFWAPVTADRATTLGDVKKAFASAHGTMHFVSLDAAQLKTVLATAPQKAGGGKGVEITIPNVNGTTEHFRVLEASNFEPGLQAQHPDIRSYVGAGVEDPSAHLRLSISPKGVQTMVLRAGKETEFIEPYTTNSAVYAVFTSGDRRSKGELPFTCKTPQDLAIRDAASNMANRSGLSDDLTFRTFRLALSCTGEYTVYHGGTKADALAAMNATLTRVNGVYEVDLAVNLLLIDNEEDIIYTSASTDPYSNAANMDNWNDELQTNLTTVIGEANYDIGHLFGATGGGGNAGCIGCVCTDNSKGSGITSPADGVPEGDSFDIDYVAHEMGHQLGATHTFSYNYEGSGTNVEPGSGSTIMGYAGITGSYDVQLHSDDYFAYISILQIEQNLQTKTCAVTSTLSNAAITINAGANYSIPKGTAFVLSAVGAGANGENVTYNWEQNDDGSAATDNDDSFASPTKTAGPTFRSVAPSTSTVRYMPAFSSVLNNTLSTTWESVSNVARTLHFTLTGRDNAAGGGQTHTDAMTATVKSAAGPFLVTSQNTDNLSWSLNSQQTITWDVAGTTGNNINTANVKILLSTDNGATFPTVLAESTPNDGSEIITVPAGAEGFNCRIMVQAIGNIFYALNTKTFAIGYAVTTNCTTYTNSTGFAIPDGGSNYTTQNLSVPAGAAATAIHVSVDITHPYVSDLIISVLNPGGTTVNLWNAQCGSNNNLDVTFSDSGTAVTCGNPTSGTYAPVSPLAPYAGTTAQGTWTLGVIDVYSGDAGSVNSWSIDVCTQTGVPLGNEEFGLSQFSVYPNPNSGSFTVAFNSDSQNNIGITVHDMRGREVFSNSYTNTGLFSGSVNLKNVQSGVYLVTVQDGGRKEVRKIVVN